MNAAIYLIATLLLHDGGTVPDYSYRPQPSMEVCLERLDHAVKNTYAPDHFEGVYDIEWTCEVRDDLPRTP